MRVLLLPCGSGGAVEPVVGLAMQLRALGAEARVCAPPDCAEPQAAVSVAPSRRASRPVAARTVRRKERV